MRKLAKYSTELTKFTEEKIEITANEKNNLQDAKTYIEDIHFVSC